MATKPYSRVKSPESRVAHKPRPGKPNSTTPGRWISSKGELAREEQYSSSLIPLESTYPNSIPLSITTADKDALFSSNVPPTKGQEDALRWELGVMESQMSAWMESLRIQKERIRLFKTVLSPIRHVPAEIISHILSFALADEMDREEGMDYEDRKRVLDFCLVCRRWQDAALLTHRLWTSLCIDMSTASFIVLYPWIKQWFERAGPFPKRLGIDTLQCDNSGKSGTKQHGGDYCLALCAAGSRRLAQFVVQEGPWSSITFNLPTVQCFRRFTNSLEMLQDDKSAWTELPSLNLKIRDNWSKDKASLAALPRVKSLSLLSYPPVKIEDPDSANVPRSVMSNIVEFRIHCVWETIHIVRQLHMCPQLERCTLVVDEFCPMQDFAPWGWTVALHNLTWLTLSGPGIQHQQILQRLEVPALQVLRLWFDNWVIRPHLTRNKLRLFATQSGCSNSIHTLEVRCLKERDAAEQIVGGIVEKLPYIRHLRLQEVDMGHELLGWISKHTPYLESIELLDMPPTFSGRRFWNFVDLRRKDQQEVGVVYNTSRSDPPPRASIERARLTYRSAPGFCEPGAKVYI